MGGWGKMWNGEGEGEGGRTDLNGLMKGDEEGVEKESETS